jgi:hypothetical protein
MTASAQQAGNAIRNVAPAAELASSVTSPPTLRATRRASASPRPLPALLGKTG